MKVRILTCSEADVVLAEAYALQAFVLFWRPCSNLLEEANALPNYPRAYLSCCRLEEYCGLHHQAPMMLATGCSLL